MRRDAAPMLPGQALRRARARLALIGFAFAIAWAGLAARLVDLAAFDGIVERETPRAAATQPVPRRADIVDASGRVLATSVATVSAYADPQRIIDPSETATKLADILGTPDAGTLYRRLTRETRFVWIKRHLAPEMHVALHNLGLPGIAFRGETRRIYPAGALAAHVHGYTDVDSRGLAGLEKAFDGQLAGGGAPLRLTLDARVQHVVRNALSHAIAEFQAIGAAGVVMDARTGGIVAMVSLPDFDPHHPGTALKDARFNRASLGVYEMGSTLKAATTALALESGAVHLGDAFDVTRPITLGRFTIRDHDPHRGFLSVPEVFMHSSNIGTAQMAMAVGIDGQRDFLDALGLTRPAPLEVPEIGRPMVPERWGRVHNVTISYGHGLAVSPIQLTAAIAALINGGTYHPPSLLADRPAAGHRVISPQTSQIMRQLLRLTVTQGTGSKADAPGWLVGGKTGTAEKAVARGYSEEAMISSFVGAFPMHDPAYVVFVMIDEPKGHDGTFGWATGGWVAAPAVRRIVAEAAPILGVAPLLADGEAIDETLALGLKRRTLIPREALVERPQEAWAQPWSRPRLASF